MFLGCLDKWSKFGVFVHALNGYVILLIDDLAFQFESGGEFPSIYAEFDLKDGEPLNFVGIGDGLGVCCVDASLDGL